MNLSYSEARQFISTFSDELSRLKDADPKLFDNSHRDQKSLKILNFESFKLRSPFCFFPQAVHASLFENLSAVNWGAQDFYFESYGAFTGQNSPEVFQELGANMMLVGHSERRTLFAETDDMIHNKLLKCQSLGLIPMLCVGETYLERNKKQTLQVLEQQLQKVLKHVSLKHLMVAYEPVWAIGSGLTASVEDVEEAHGFIKNLLGFDIPVLYGGSVKPDNAQQLSSLKSVDGFLIGGASLKVESLLSIYKNSMK